MTNQEAIVEFIAELQSYQGSLDRMQAACERRIADLYDCYADNTVHASMTDYRNAMREHIAKGTLDRMALEYFRKPKEKADERRKDFKSALKRDLQQGREIQNPDDLIRIAKNLLVSNSYIDIGLGLMLLTGRRPVEVFKTATFALTEEPYHVLFSGQAKTRDRDEGKRPYNIPVFDDPHVIVNALARLRSLKDFSNASERDIHNTMSKTLNEKFKRVFARYLPGCKPTHLRSLYAVLAYEVFAPKGTFFPSFASDVLGHGEDDTYTAQSYMDFFIVRESLLTEKE